MTKQSLAIVDRHDLQSRDDKPLKVLVIVGPTASGKTNLARFLAEKYNGEIVSADSRQVYKYLDIGTGKDGLLRANEVSATSLREKYPYLRYINDTPQWLTDYVEPKGIYTVAGYQADCYEVVADIFSRGKLPIITGGTGLYVSAVLEGYQFNLPIERDQQNPRHAAKREHKKTPPNWDMLTIGIDLPRKELYKRIDKRVTSRIEQGLIAEGHDLIKKGLTTRDLRRFGLEYRFLADLLENKITVRMFQTNLQLAIHTFARRQLTWWRHHGEVKWVTSVTQAETLLKEDWGK